MLVVGNPSTTILFHIIIRCTLNIFLKTLHILQKDTKVGSQNFCYQIWFCTRLMNRSLGKYSTGLNLIKAGPSYTWTTDDAMSPWLAPFLPANDFQWLSIAVSPHAWISSGLASGLGSSKVHVLDVIFRVLGTYLNLTLWNSKVLGTCISKQSTWHLSKYFCQLTNIQA